MKTVFKSLFLMACVLTATSLVAQNTSGNKTTKTMKATVLNAQDFREKVYDYENSKEWAFAGERPAIIDFYATWCGPCKMMAPVMDTLAEEYQGRVDIYKVDVDKEQHLASLFGVRSIPTFVFIPKDGKPRVTTGAMGIEVMRRYIDKELLGQE